MKINLFVARENQVFELGIFSFNLYVFSLTRGFIASTRAFNLLTRTFNLPTRAFMGCSYEVSWPDYVGWLG